MKYGSMDGLVLMVTNTGNTHGIILIFHRNIDGFRFRFSLNPLILSLTILTSIAKHVMIIAYQLIRINTYNLLIMTIYNDSNKCNDSNDYNCLIN